MPAIQAGAAGFLSKDTTPDFLSAAIRTGHSGHSVIAPALTNELPRDCTTPAAWNDAALADLSGRWTGVTSASKAFHSAGKPKRGYTFSPPGPVRCPGAWGGRRRRLQETGCGSSVAADGTRYRFEIWSHA